MAPSTISTDKGMRPENMPSESNISDVIAKIRDMLFGDMILFHHLFGSSPISQAYLQDCDARYIELDKIGSMIEHVLRTYIEPVS